MNHAHSLNCIFDLVGDWLGAILFELTELLVRQLTLIFITQTSLASTLVTNVISKMLTIVKPSLWIRLPLCAQSRLVNSLDLARPSSSKSSKKDEPKDNRSVFENLSKLTEKPFSTCLKKLYSKYPIEIDKIFWSIMEDPKYEKCSIQTRLQLTAYLICQRHGFVQLKAGKNKLRSTEASISDHGQYLEDFEEGILISTDNTDLIDPFEPRTYKVHDSVSHVPWYQRSLKQQTSAMRLLSTSSRKFSTSSTLVKSNQRPPLKKPPSLLSQLVPNFVSSGLQIDSFRRKIDPNFDPQDFLEGTKLVSPSSTILNLQ